MAPDQMFKRWVHIALAIFALSFIYFLVADLWMPVSTQSRVLHPVVNISSKVSGQVETIYVQNNQNVEAGQVLFSLDKRPYEIAVEKAQLAIESATQNNLQLDAAITAAKAQVVASKADVDELALEVDRVDSLIKSNTVSRQLYDQTKANYQAAKAQVEATQADVINYQAQRGKSGGENLLLRQAQNTLQNAQLQLQYADVRSQVKGQMSNLQLQPGNYAQAGSAVAAVVVEKGDIVADFREKSLSHVQIGDDASIVFDAHPGQVFQGRVAAIDAGVKDGQLSADGSLANPENSDRWVRDAQYMRTHIVLKENQSLLKTLPSGARATVQLHPVGGLASWLGSLQAHVISVIHYIY